MKLKVGQTLNSAVDATSVVVVRAPENDVTLTCGGAPMRAPGEASAEPATAEGEPGGGLLLGKRYVEEALGLEALCIKPGDHPVAVNGVALAQKNAQPLPASD